MLPPTSYIGQGESGCSSGSPPSRRSKRRGCVQVSPPSVLTDQNGLPDAVRITQNNRPSGSFTSDRFLAGADLRMTGKRHGKRLVVGGEPTDLQVRRLGIVVHVLETHELDARVGGDPVLGRRFSAPRSSSSA